MHDTRTTTATPCVLWCAVMRCMQDITPTSMLLHYFSSRPGLCPIVVGVLKGLCEHYW